MSGNNESSGDPELVRLGVTLVAAARGSHQRRGLILDGGREWCCKAAEAVLAGAGLDHVLWVSDRAAEDRRSVRGRQARGLLGQELDGVVFDAHAGFDPEAFGAIAGTIRGGGLLLVLTPPLERWVDLPDPEQERVAVYPYQACDLEPGFVRRLERLVRETADLARVSEQGGQHLPAVVMEVRPCPGEDARRLRDCSCRTKDQEEAVEAVLRVVNGHRRRPAVLVSDRGRGKSTALGIAAARLLRQGLQRILVTAPRLDAAAPVFAHAERLLSQEGGAKASLHFGSARMEFVAPSYLVLEPRPADLLLVDEAAGIPGPLLETLLRRYSRIVFATTVHGYEGTGRGFAVRFRQVLDRRTPQWKEVRLEAPIRWAGSDPVERFVFKALLLDAAPAPVRALTEADGSGFTIERLEQGRLLRDEPLLSELFGLLVLAHYRTRPLDLRNLLDGPGQSVWVVRHGRHVAATALVSHEGGFDADLAERVWAGWRRPRGHMIPQSLAVHAGLRQAPELRCDRVVRIAVHPAVRQRGLGTRLLEAVIADARAGRRDLVGASFGVSEDLLRFWARSALQPVRLGFHRDASSGAHSALVLCALSSAGAALFATARERFLDHFPDWLGDPLRGLEPSLALALMGRSGNQVPVLTADDWQDLISFAFGRRDYEVCMAAVRKLILLGLTSASARTLVSDSDWHLLIRRVLQQRSWNETLSDLELRGRAAAQESMRSALRPLVLEFGDSDLRHQAERLIACATPA